jgi:hypothetical protein
MAEGSVPATGSAQPGSRSCEGKGDDPVMRLAGPFGPAPSFVGQPLSSPETLSLPSELASLAGAGGQLLVG